MKAKAPKHHYWRQMTPEEIKAFNEQEANLDEVLADIERTAEAILIAAGFPRDLQPPFNPPDLVLRKQIEERGFDWESREGYAVRILHQAWLVRTARPKSDAAAIHAMYLGALITETTMHKHWDLGISIREGGRKGAAHHGSPEDRRKKKERLRRLFDEERPKVASNAKAYEAVAKLEKVKPRTVRRAVTGQ
jgi:hypothetical protein